MILLLLMNTREGSGWRRRPSTLLGKVLGWSNLWFLVEDQVKLAAHAWLRCRPVARAAQA
jgi:hypothetical protein